MFKISLNNKSFLCDSNTTIFEAAKYADIHLEHSCLVARCRSCIVEILKGKTRDKTDDLVLSDDEKNNNLALSCNAIPTSDLVLNANDLGTIKLYEKRIFPAKIKNLEKINKDVLKVVLRLPPNSNFKYNSGQYVNLIKSDLKRSYSIANTCQDNNNLEFYIKKYEIGLMSQYWFNEAQKEDLLRIEGPLGSFFLRENTPENIIFLATGTGIAPIKAILEQISKEESKYSEKKIWLFFGARYKEDLFWDPCGMIENLNFIKVLSRESDFFDGFKGYVQNAVLHKNIDLANSQVYACGSIQMINSAKKSLLNKSLKEGNFFSDAFVETN